MDSDERHKLKNLIMKHEGYREFVYTDTTGHLTIGFGHNLEARGLSVPLSSAVLDDDINYWVMKLTQSIGFFDTLNPARKSVLIDMCHNLGVNGLLEFRDMLDSLLKKDYEQAAKDMLASKWAQQVGHRALENAEIMKTGKI